MTAPLDLTGRRFGRLTALHRADSRHGRTAWECCCDCGSTRVVTTTGLVVGDALSCGCLHAETAAEKGRRKLIDMTGRRVGRLVILGRADGSGRGGEARWACVCDCGTLTAAIGVRLRRGSCLSCGCLRDELARARARAAGAAKRVKACRTCGRIYTATGSQKSCSPECVRAWHAADEAQRRDAKRLAGLFAVQAELQRRLDGGEESGNH